MNCKTYNFFEGPNLTLLTLQFSTMGQADFIPSKDFNWPDISANDPSNHCIWWWNSIVVGKLWWTLSFLLLFKYWRKWVVVAGINNHKVGLKFTFPYMYLQQKKVCNFCGCSSLCHGAFKLPIILNNCNKGQRRNPVHVDFSKFLYPFQ